MIKILAVAFGMFWPTMALASEVTCLEYTHHYRAASTSQERLSKLLSNEFQTITSFTLGAFLAISGRDFSATPDVEKGRTMVALYDYCQKHPEDDLFDASIRAARESRPNLESAEKKAPLSGNPESNTPRSPPKTFTDMLDPEVMAAISKLKFISQKVQINGPLPSVLFQIKNESDHAFSMLAVECGVMKGDAVVASATGFVMNLQPGQTASSEANFMLTKEALDADHADCRASMGL